MCQVGRTRLVTRLIEGEFPKYRQLVPEGYPNKLAVDRGEFSQAVQRVRMLAAGREANSQSSSRPSGAAEAVPPLPNGWGEDRVEGPGLSSGIICKRKKSLSVSGQVTDR